jgi:hypothetical protein
MPDEGAEAAKTLRAFSDRNSALNDLREAKLAEVTARAGNIDAQTQAAETEVANALERGDWSAQAAAQRRVSELAARRVAVESEYQRWQSQPVHPHDPIQALLDAKASEPETVRWLKANPLDAAILATNSSLARVAQIQSSHAAAVAAGHVAGSKSYFDHIDRALGSLGGKTTRGGGGSRGGMSGGEAEVRLTKKEAEAAVDGSVCWGREGGSKIGQPVGIEEYARRKAVMTKEGTWYERLD